MKKAIFVLALLAFSLAPVEIKGQEQKLLAQAKEAFFNERFGEAEQLALAARAESPGDPENYELRTAILLFRLKAELGVTGKKSGGRDAKDCGPCGPLLAEFHADLEAGLAKSRAILAREPTDPRARFLLAKILLNRLWLNLQVLRRKKGLGEYREARRILDSLLESEPDNIRALTARAWIEYVVGGQFIVIRTILGGGDKAKALRDLRRAATLTGDEYDLAEAKAALIEMLASEREEADAKDLAAELAPRFPGNRGFKSRAEGGTK